MQIFGNSKMLMTAVGHLIENGIRYNVPNGQVVVNGETTAEQHILYIEDSGIGIARKELDYIFQPFFQADDEESNVDGFEVCRILKGGARTKGSHILRLTALGKDEEREKGSQAGADGYFTKPFSPLELMSKVEEILK